MMCVYGIYLFPHITTLCPAYSVDPWGDSPKASSSSNGFGSQPFSTQGAAVPAAAAPMFSPPIQVGINDSYYTACVGAFR